MTILGVDIGIAITGIGVVEKQGNNINYIYHTAIETHKSLPIPERLQILYNEFNKIVLEYKPVLAAVEELFFFKNAKTIIPVGEARGVVMLALQQQGLLIEEYTPLEVKQAVSSYGRADKKQVQAMVKMLYNLKEIPKPDDAADALAIAWCAAASIKNIKGLL